MRFLIDAQLPRGLADRLAEAGHDARHVNDIGLATASDRHIWTHCQTTGRVLLTKDADFRAFQREADEGPALVWIRIGNATNNRLWALLEPALPEILAALEAGERFIEVR